MRTSRFAIVFIVVILVFSTTGVGLDRTAEPAFTITRAPAAAVTSQENSNDPELININTADAKELSELPGIGDVLSERIIAYRKAYGMFKSIDQIKNVKGIGEKKFNAIRNMICIR